MWNVLFLILDDSLNRGDDDGREGDERVNFGRRWLREWWRWKGWVDRHVEIGVCVFSVQTKIHKIYKKKRKLKGPLKRDKPSFVFFFSSFKLTLKTFPSESTGELEVARLDRHAAAVDGTQARVGEEIYEMGLSRFLHGKDGTCGESHSVFARLGDFADEALER